jgi:hypothetical protein
MRDPLPGFDLQGGLIAFGIDRRDGLTFVSGYLKPEPRLPVGIVEVDVASGQIGDTQGHYHRFVSDVLQSLEFQVHLNLPLRDRGKKQNTGTRQNAL